MICRLVLLLVLMCASFAVAAECSRSDADYYLRKGLTHEQVTALCENAQSERRGEYRPYESSNREEERARSAERKREEDELMFKASIDARNVDLTPARLAYTRRFCTDTGKTETEGRTDACPEVRYYIYFKNLKVVGQKRKYFFLGQREIEVVGTVKRRLLHNLKNYPEDLRQELLQSYKTRSSKKGTVIPIRRDMPISQVIETLREYAY